MPPKSIAGKRKAPLYAWVDTVSIVLVLEHRTCIQNSSHFCSGSETFNSYHIKTLSPFAHPAEEVSTTV